MAQRTAAEALAFIDDPERKDELEALQGHNRKDGDVWDTFYERYKEIKEQHRKSTSTVPQVSNTRVENFFD